MTITGRLTADAAVATTKEERQVVNFTVAVNDRYKNRAGEVAKVTAYYNCLYWISPKMAQYLKKATLVELDGRVAVNAYVGNDGTAKAAMTCHVNNIKILAWPKEVEAIGVPIAAAEKADTTGDDMPF
jgi:single-strand DNA-binding protein